MELIPLLVLFLVLGWSEWVAKDSPYDDWLKEDKFNNPDLYEDDE